MDLHTGEPPQRSEPMTLTFTVSAALFNRLWMSYQREGALNPNEAAAELLAIDAAERLGHTPYGIGDVAVEQGATHVTITADVDASPAIALMSLSALREIVKSGAYGSATVTRKGGVTRIRVDDYRDKRRLSQALPVKWVLSEPLLADPHWTATDGGAA